MFGISAGLRASRGKGGGGGKVSFVFRQSAEAEWQEKAGLGLKGLAFVVSVCKWFGCLVKVADWVRCVEAGGGEVWGEGLHRRGSFVLKLFFISKNYINFALRFRRAFCAPNLSETI